MALDREFKIKHGDLPDDIADEFRRVYRILTQQARNANEIEESAGGGGAGGDVVGPASSVNNQIVLFDGITGKLIKAATGTGPVKAAAGVYSVGPLDLGDPTEIFGTLPASSVSGLGHNVLSTTHTDSEPNPAQAMAMIYGKYTDLAVAWFEGLPTGFIATADDLGTMKYWFEGLPIASIGTAVTWARLSPPTAAGQMLGFDGTQIGWV